jgi:transcriptional regulator with XRE-family HTH domain
MDSDSAPTLDEVIGRAVRTLREQRKMPQDALARACRRKGLHWSRSSIAMLETGRRSCSISELLIVASALDAPLRLIVSGEGLPDRPNQVMLTTTTAANLAAVSESLVGRADHPARLLNDLLKIGLEAGQAKRAWSVESGDADQKAARRLGVNTERLMSEAEALWGTSLTAERERRIAERERRIEESGSPLEETITHLEVAASPARESNDPQRTLRALRGHVTRELLKELRTAFDRPGED